MANRIKSCTLMEKYIYLIQQGKKTVEGRVAIPSFERWKEGDIITFFSKRNPEIKVQVKIIEKVHYKTFRQMIKTEGVKNLIPNIDDIDEGEKIYLKIPKYAEREKQFGVLAFRLEPIQS